MENRDLFAHKSKEWDMNSRRVQGAKAIANSILKNIELTKDMHIMDFGAGTGLLSYCLSHTVGRVTAIDNSPSMLEVFHKKASLFNCPTEVIELDLSQEIPNTLLFDGIVSSMTIHHIRDIEDMLTKMYNMLSDDGFIALADLDIEDGTFHSDNEGVFHFGFDRDELVEIAKRVGFRDVEIETANVIEKPHRSFEVFLMSAKR
ncbi:methyltransferase, putative [hydrothermal vent metagenome]|uniref:Methyltransferase, putative n=1 Tax=hydrothermal vent metagenome TaxID=652676 RepID=A0A1W1CJR4_9ZZZZ